MWAFIITYAFLAGFLAGGITQEGIGLSYGEASHSLAPAGNKAPSCQPPLIRVGEGVPKWGTKNDEEVLQLAKKQCKIKFPQSPCVAEVWKLGRQSYHIICGRKK